MSTGYVRPDILARMLRVGVLVVAIVACSSPQSTTPSTPAAPPDDDDASVKWQHEHPPPPKQPEPYAFDWDKVRAANETWLAKPLGDDPCDPRRVEPPLKGTECLPIDRNLLVAAVIRHTDVDGDHFVFTVDRGEDAALTKEFYVAILDPKGHPLTPWVHLDRVFQDRAFFSVARPFHMKVLSGETHVAIAHKIPRGAQP
jgi:hypothetical protein